MRATRPIEPDDVGWGVGHGPGTPFDPDRPEQAARLARGMLAVGRLLAVFTAALGALVLFGYAVRSATIVQLAPSLPPMYPNAALGFLVGGVAVRLAASSGTTSRRVTVVLGAFLTALGAVMLGLHIADAGSTWVEGLWPNDPFVEATTPVGGRPVPETCLAFIAAGSAIVLLGLRRLPLVAQGLALAATTVGVAAVLGYAIGVDRTALGSSFVAVGMALHTGVGVTTLGLAALLVRPTVGLLGLLTNAGPGGRLARRLVAVTLAAPLLLAAATALLQDVLPDARLAQSVAAVVQVGALGLLVMVPAAAIIRFDRIATAATREARRQLEAAGERDAIIRDIAAHLLTPPPAPRGWRLAVHQEPAVGQLAGDSLVLLDGDAERFLLAVIDIAGHGTLPALQAYRLRIELASLWRQGLELADIAGQLDLTVAELDTIATGVLLSVDRTTGDVSVVNAGHPPPILVHGRSTSSFGLGRLFGLRSQHDVSDSRLERDDLVVIYTDGVSEARPPHGPMLGDDTVQRLIGTWAPSGPDVVVQQCVDAAKQHAGHRLHDDALVVALQRV